MPLQSLKQLYVEQLRDLYDAEQQILPALQEMEGAASEPELKTAFGQHYRQTQEHVRRLEQIFNRLGEEAKGVSCKGMKGIIEEGKMLMQKPAETEVRDAALICAAQHVEHYEIAGYGCVRTYARTLGLQHDVELLQRTLDEEEGTDDKLTRIAEQVVNLEAARA